MQPSSRVWLSRGHERLGSNIGRRLLRVGVSQVISIQQAAAELRKLLNSQQRTAALGEVQQAITHHLALALSHGVEGLGLELGAEVKHRLQQLVRQLMAELLEIVLHQAVELDGSPFTEGIQRVEFSTRLFSGCPLRGVQAVMAATSAAKSSSFTSMPSPRV